ncbi:hypothetical protein FSP39_010759 [Pinctada imbricata]|uniref:Galactose-3-O-sulfotransferase 2-like n=1 Tax=Pinctada imbricata TaxID=66713 RepID=A0AA88XWA9_PINIB|nr:hypothetical protein FSP39_010759 [Pinctada imbricata]
MYNQTVVEDPHGLNFKDPEMVERDIHDDMENFDDGNEEPDKSDSIKNDPSFSENLKKLSFWEEQVQVKKGMEEKQNFVFIKCMKCATETVAGLLRRFSFTRHLDVVLPRHNNIYLGWPYLMVQEDFRMGNSKFNCLMEHSIYNRSIMKPLFHDDVKFISIIREPWAHFLSTFKYFNVKNIVKMKENDLISSYLTNIEKYETIYKSHKSAKLRYCIPDGFSVTKNLLSHCLGMPLGFPSEREDISGSGEKVTNYIHQLDKEMDLVMIMEYFHESLVLLKRVMGWSFLDIIYRKVNVGHYHYNTSAVDKERHRLWSNIDYQLYEHFNQTFWNKVKTQGEAFTQEVRLFKSIIHDIDQFCKSVNATKLPNPGNVTRQSFTIEASDFDGGFTISALECGLLEEPLLPLLQTRFALRHGKDTEYKRTC